MTDLARSDLTTWFVVEGRALARERAANPSTLAAAQLDGRIEAHVRAARRICGEASGTEVLNAIKASAPEVMILA